MVKLFTWSSSILLSSAFLVVSADRQTAPVSEIPPIPLACNNFPTYYNIPLNRFFWLGAHDATAQERSLTDMLIDGIRLLDLKLCSSSKDTIVACSDSALSLQDISDEIFNYAREQEEQIIVLNINLSEDLSLSQFEETWDQVCKLHTERLEGVDDFVKGQCPFIYKKDGAWETLGELVNVDPEMPQWEGDGELVGVRSRIILTTPRKLSNTAYFSPKFWRPSPKQDASDLNDQIYKLCKTPGAIGIEGYVDPSKDKRASNSTFDATLWENTIISRKGCDIDNTGAGVYFNMIQVDDYYSHLEYLHELQTRMIPVNFAKLKQGSLKKRKIEPSKLVKVHHPHDRDEL
ncbi:hypothetical protein BDA99DRAFT_510109 [Phascolomyces articulosus]|uniref:PLC-like phosphodiesterase n=1 Tax=Phascolomyces articulosus TaxID=60185 RepID=A0AAD5KAM6_9FUNG|nr:hypothetical protein BDA99DRAFT_510109 [Phascolomyces articulosus]